FVGLEDLTIRGSFRRSIGPLWIDGTGESYWGAYSNLTRLQLIDCGNVYPPQIAELICHFPSLEYFLISACGHGPSRPHGREKGWSSQPSGWWNQRKPLTLMHIEHMLAWEMLVMGTIPALEIRTVSLYTGDLARTFMDDNEVFPHLKLLRAECLEGKRFGGRGSLENERSSETDLKV
ncbi:12153_t:CDS:1, partial [Acaulospora colombiana]